MGNIFEGAKFGDRFQTRDGRMAIYLGYNRFGMRHWHQLVLENTPDVDSNVRIKEYDKDGTFYSAPKDCNYSDDIIGKWQEEIDERKIERLALRRYTEFVNSGSGLGIPNDHFQPWVQDLCVEFYKAGYRQEKEKL